MPGLSEFNLDKRVRKTRASCGSDTHEPPVELVPGLSGFDLDKRMRKTSATFSVALHQPFSAAGQPL